MLCIASRTLHCSRVRASLFERVVFVVDPRRRFLKGSSSSSTLGCRRRFLKGSSSSSTLGCRRRFLKGPSSSSTPFSSSSSSFAFSSSSSSAQGFRASHCKVVAIRNAFEPLTAKLSLYTTLLSLSLQSCRYTQRF